jgi:DNA polymerase
MIEPVLIDFESRSRVDLRVLGGRRYWEHPSSEALCCVWFDTRDATIGVWVPGQAWPHAGRVLAAHNAMGFDMHAAARYDFAAAGWIDTAQLARKAGLPGALDALGTRWCGVPKDAEGSRFTRALSSVRRPTKKSGSEISAAEWRTLDDAAKRQRGALPIVDAAAMARVIDYCASDVAILAYTWPRLAEWLPVDAAAEELDAIINARGIAFDDTLARRLLAEDHRLASSAVASAATKLDLDPATVEAMARSPQQFCAATGAPDAQAETVATLDHPLAQVRRALASISRGKLEAGIARVHTAGRLRDTLRYYGAHTGRWSGQGMQLQNLTRPAKRFEGVDVDTLASNVLAGAPADAETIALLVRATLTASPGNMLVAQDFSSVEARATAWCAGDLDALAVFASGRDPYKVAAAAVFSCEYDAVDKQQRQIGKCCELGLGYGGGPNAFVNIAHAYKIPPSVLEPLDLEAIVAAWRALHAPIRALWYACERAFRAACGGRSQGAGPFEYASSDAGDAVACFLPSGRPIVYNDAACNEEGACTYHGTKSREHVYGGKLVENAVQAFCRDLMVHALLAAEQAGLNPVLHVHDEIVCDVPEQAAQAAAELLHACMVDLPAWAADFPVGADGWIGRRYRK